MSDTVSVWSPCLWCYGLKEAQRPFAGLPRRCGPGGALCRGKSPSENVSPAESGELGCAEWGALPRRLGPTGRIGPEALLFWFQCPRTVADLEESTLVLSPRPDPPCFASPHFVYISREPKSRAPAQPRNVSGLSESPQLAGTRARTVSFDGRGGSGPQARPRRGESCSQHFCQEFCQGLCGDCRRFEADNGGSWGKQT